jgi:hypothetical protein
VIEMAETRPQVVEEKRGTESSRPTEWYQLDRWNAWLRTPAGWRAGLVAVLVLCVPAAVTGYLMLTADPPGSLERRTQLAMAGRPEVVQDWLGDYPLTRLSEGLWFDLAFVVCGTLLLAVAVLWVGQNYRTVTARALACPLFIGALGAGLLGVAGDLILLFAVQGHTWRWWQLATVATWGAWLVGAGVVAYVVGGLLSMLLPRRVITVLQSADRRRTPAPRNPETSEEPHELGLAFSGGGIRAASISLGALQQFEAEQTFDWGSAARVTAVSGGSYMTGGWSLSRKDGDRDRWVDVDGSPGPEERHLRANLGYLLSNTPRQTSLDNRSLTQAASHGLARAERAPGVLATVLTGLALNVFVFLSLLWVVAQLLGWFYRWYFSASCPGWRADQELTYATHHQCLSEQGRPGWPVVAWLLVGIAFMFLWVLAGKAVAVARDDTAEATTADRAGAVLLVLLKYVGYSGLAISAVCAVVLAGLPLGLELLWRPVSANALMANVIAVIGGIASASAVLRLLRRPLARFAPVIGGAIFALVLAYLGGLWTLGAMTAAVDERHTVALPVVLVVLLAIHLLGSVEMWSLAPFYRGKIRGAFATYRDGDVVHSFRSAGVAGSAHNRPEPSLWELAEHTPLTVCASATVRARGVRTHANIPALSVTFCPDHVRVFLPRESDGEFECFECAPQALDVLLGGHRPGTPGTPGTRSQRLRMRTSPRLTTMLAVGLSSAAVSPAMGRFKVGPVSMLLAFFNVRLGMWVPNPRFADELAAQGRPLPRPGLGYLLKEFVGYHDPSDLYLYVTDGGHWENTGLVELLRSRDVSEAVCIDADSGPGNLATSIARAVDLAKLECDARVVLRLDQLRADRDPSPGRDYSPRSVNLGLVQRHYPGEKEDRIALLWYAKPALTQDMPPHLLAYREVDRTFPRVSTVNQFFHIAQFAAYRDLGRFNASMMIAARRILVDALAQHATYAEFAGARQKVPRKQVDRRPDWVLDELVGLIEQLAQLQPVDGYREAIYAQVREILGSAPAPAVTTDQLPQDGAPPSAGHLATSPPGR